MRLAERVLSALAILPVSADAVEVAARLGPPALRTGDALHLAAALSLGDRLSSVVAYDQRLLDAAVALGLPVASPGVG